MALALSQPARNIIKALLQSYYVPTSDLTTNAVSVSMSSQITANIGNYNFTKADIFSSKSDASSRTNSKGTLIADINNWQNLVSTNQIQNVNVNSFTAILNFLDSNNIPQEAEFKFGLTSDVTLDKTQSYEMFAYINQSSIPSLNGLQFIIVMKTSGSGKYLKFKILPFDRVSSSIPNNVISKCGHCHHHDKRSFKVYVPLSVLNNNTISVGMSSNNLGLIGAQNFSSSPAYFSERDASLGRKQGATLNVRKFESNANSGVSSLSFNLKSVSGEEINFNIVVPYQFSGIVPNSQLTKPITIPITPPVPVSLGTLVAAPSEASAVPGVGFYAPGLGAEYSVQTEVVGPQIALALLVITLDYIVKSA